jgi:hypothetical protein
MKRRRGFALIAVLWVVAALAGIVGLALSAARLGQQTSLNRIALTRGRWAAEACLAVAQARWAEHRLADTATVDLGRRTRCHWQVTDVTARLNVNTADAGVLQTLLCPVPRAPCALDTLLRLRTADALTDLDQVAALPSMDSAALPLLTVDGPGSVNVNAAPPRLLLAFPGLTPEAVAATQDRRLLGRPIANLDGLVAELSLAGRAVLLAHYGDLARQVTFAAPEYELTCLGWVEGTGGPDALHATVDVLAVPLPDRLAIVQRKLS